MCDSDLANQFVSVIDIKTINCTGAYECRVEYHKRFYSDDLFSCFSVQLPIALADSSLDRKAEFLAGRIAAKEVLECLGVLGCQVNIGALRQPIWPEGVTGSITHARSIAVCIAGKLKYVGKIGVDVEPWIDERVTEEIKNEIISKQEISNLSSLHWPFNYKLTLCFSIKESLFKALSAILVGSYHFYDLEVIAISPLNKNIKVRLLKEISSHYMKGYVFDCNYSETFAFICTHFIETCGNENGKSCTPFNAAVIANH